MNCRFWPPILFETAGHTRLQVVYAEYHESTALCQSRALIRLLPGCFALAIYGELVLVESSQVTYVPFKLDDGALFEVDESCHL